VPGWTGLEDAGLRGYLRAGRARLGWAQRRWARRRSTGDEA